MFLREKLKSKKKMKLPNKIETLTELVGWINRKLPKIKTIEIRKSAKILKISEFGNKKWKYFRDIPVKYLK